MERIFSVTAQNSMRRWIKPLSAVAAVVVVVAAFMLTPLGSYAQGFLNLFTPKQFVALPATPQQMRTLPDLSDYGEMTKLQDPTTKRVASADEAAAAAGFALAKPGFLPAGVANKTEYAVMGGAQGKFTFSAAKTQATAAKKGKALPPMPANIDGSTLNINIPTAVVTSYGEVAGFSPDGRSVIRPDQAASPRNVPREALKTQAGALVVVAQMKAPTVTSSGVSVAELQQYLLSQPGIDPQLAASLRAITDPTSTLPVPIPVDQVTARPIQVQGVSGLFLGDSTGLGSGVVWQKDGMIYAVGGPLKEGEVLQIANSLR